MNERIRELAEQCYEKHELLGTYEFNKEKFAELIVRECINALPDQTEPVVDTAKRIRAHFGVEE